MSLSQFGKSQYNDGIPVYYRNRHDQLLAEAVRNAGPKTGLVGFDLDAGKLWYGLVRDGETDRGSAHYLGGYTAVVTLTTANVTFADGSTTATVTTSDQPPRTPTNRYDSSRRVSVLPSHTEETGCGRHQPDGP